MQIASLARSTHRIGQRAACAGSAGSAAISSATGSAGLVDPGRRGVTRRGCLRIAGEAARPTRVPGSQTAPAATTCFPGQSERAPTDRGSFRCCRACAGRGPASAAIAC